MYMHPKKRKGEPSPPIRNTGPEPAATPAHMPASRFFQPREVGRIQPLDGTGNGSETFETYMTSAWTSVAASSDFEYAAAAGSSVSALKLPPPVAPITESLNATQGDAAREPLNPDPVYFTTSPRPGGDRPFTSFTIPPTEEDLKQLQFGQDKNGYIKRPPNAFFVWSHIYRRKICPGASVMDISVALGREWSKLSEKQKRPYYEAAYKLKYMHRQQFPDYEFRPQKKKNKECLSSGQGAGPDPGISLSQAVPPNQSESQGPNMYLYPAMMPCTAGYCYMYPHNCLCHQMGLFHGSFHSPYFATDNQMPAAPWRM